jgi:DNA-binding LacI/PurR family transcriptional regulator
VAGYDRYQGYLQALQDYDRTIRSELVVEGDFNEEGGYHAMARLLPQKPDSVFAASDMTAYGAMRAIHEANLRIPEDVAVVGFDDISASARTIPALTTVRQPVLQMGSKAAEVLINIIENDIKSTQQLIMDTELVVRESCGASQRR